MAMEKHTLQSRENPKKVGLILGMLLGMLLALIFFDEMLGKCEPKILSQMVGILMAIYYGTTRKNFTFPKDQLRPSNGRVNEPAVFQGCVGPQNSQEFEGEIGSLGLIF